MNFALFRRGPVEASPPSDALRLATIAYLALPYVIFAFGWLRAPYASLLAAATLGGAWLAAKPRGRARAVGAKTWLPVLALAIVWTSFSGIGGHGVQNLMDHAKHNAILGDLIGGEWPVRYDHEVPGEHFGLVYYVAYYLPAAAIGKVAGWAGANQVLFAWATLGAFLALAWFRAVTRRDGPLPPFLFIVAGGLDIAGWLALKHAWPGPMDHLDHWFTGYEYSSMTTLLYWVPQHALGAWLLTGLLLDDLRAKRGADAGFLLALGALWSPLAAIGLLPFAALAAFKGRKDLASAQNLLAAPIIAAVMAAYFSASISGARLGTPRPELLRLGGFMLAEFGIYAVVLLLLRQPKEPDDHVPFTVALACLFLLPFFHFGANNDLVMRASIPALFVFWAAAARAAIDALRARRARLAAAVLLGLFALSALSAAHEIAWGARGSWSDPASAVRWRYARPDDPVTGGPRTLGDLREPWFVRQYLGDGRSFFFRRLALPPARGSAD